MSPRYLNIQRAFSLIELLAVLVVLGIVFAFTLPQFFSTTIGARSAAQQFVSFWNRAVKEAALTREPSLIGFPSEQRGMGNLALRSYATFAKEGHQWEQTSAWVTLPDEFYFLDRSHIAFRPPHRLQTLHDASERVEVRARMAGSSEIQSVEMLAVEVLPGDEKAALAAPAFAIGRGELNERGSFQPFRGSGMVGDESNAQLILIHPQTRKARLVELER